MPCVQSGCSRFLVFWVEVPMSFNSSLRRLLSPVVISLGLFSPGGTWVPTEDLLVLPKIVFLSQLPFCHQGSGGLPNLFPLFLVFPRILVFPRALGSPSSKWEVFLYPGASRATSLAMLILILHNRQRFQFCPLGLPSEGGLPGDLLTSMLPRHICGCGLVPFFEECRDLLRRDLLLLGAPRGFQFFCPPPG